MKNNNKILFRYHTALFKDSIKNIIEINDKEDLIRHLKIRFDYYDLSEDDLYFSYYGNDERLEGWEDTIIIGFENGGVIGFMNKYFGIMDKGV